MDEMNAQLKTHYQPDEISPPGGTLADVLEERGQSQSWLALRMGRPKKLVNEIIKGKAQITPDTALQLEMVLGIDAEFWLRREFLYREWLARRAERCRLMEETHWLKQLPVDAMLRAGWIEKRDDPAAQLAEVLRHYRVASPEQLDRILEEQPNRWNWPRRSIAGRRNTYLRLAWTAAGDARAERLSCGRFDRKALRLALRQVSREAAHDPQTAWSQALDLCQAAGLAVTTTPCTEGVGAPSDARWVTSTLPLVQLCKDPLEDPAMWRHFFKAASYILLAGKRGAYIPPAGARTGRGAGRKAAIVDDESVLRFSEKLVEAAGGATRE